MSAYLSLSGGWALIRGWALINFFCLWDGRLFKVGANSRLGAYSNKYGTFYFETRPSPLSKIGENAFGAHFLQLYRKNEYGDPHFLFHDFNNDSASFR